MESIAWNLILSMCHLYPPVDVALVDLPEWVLPLFLRHWLVEGVITGYYLHEPIAVITHQVDIGVPGETSTSDEAWVGDKEGG